MSVGVDEHGVPDTMMCKSAAAQCMQTLATITPNGQGNFNFTANFNCPPRIPYFPSGHNTDYDNVFCLGLEYTDLLVSVLEQMSQPIDWLTAFQQLHDTVQAGIDNIVHIAKTSGA